MRLMIALLAAALLLAAGDPPEPPIELAPLAQPPPAKPAKKKKKKPAAAPEPELALPPLLPPSAPPAPPIAPSPLLTKPANEVGLIISMDTSDLPLEQGLADAVRNIISIAPGQQHPLLLPPPGKSCDIACLAQLAAAKKLDRIVTVFHQDDSVGISVFDTVPGREVSQESRATSAELQFNLATAELLACFYLVPGGCTGEVSIATAKGIQLSLDGDPLPQVEKQSLPVGVHYLIARAGDVSSLRMKVYILRERNTPLYATLGPSGPAVSATPPAAAPRPIAAPPAAVAAAAPVAPPQQHGILRPVGYGLLGAAVIAGGVGTYLGVKSKSDLNSAEAGFKQNGGAYSAADLSNLNSGNSAAHGANGLFVAAGILAVAGAALVLVFE
jgi:hypothetical protein